MPSESTLLDPATAGKAFCEKTLRCMIRSRVLDEKMRKLAFQNKGGTFFLSNAGHEMIGTVAALSMVDQKDWSCPYYRDRAFAVGRGVTSKEIIATCLSRDTEHHSGGRMMPEHFSDKSKRILCQSSVVGSQFLHAVGVAKSIQLKGLDEVVYVSGGDGSTSQGDFSEALNFASLHKLPVLFVIQDNEWAISVPAKEQTAGEDIAALVSSYPNLGVFNIDGCDFEQTATAMKEAIQRAREGEGPSVVVAKVPRLGAHSNSDDPKKYLSNDMLSQVQEKDPIPRFENWLKEMGLMDQEEIEAIHEQVQQEVEEASLEAEKLPFPTPCSAGTKVFKEVALPTLEKIKPSYEEDVVIVDAINHGIDEEMQRDDSIIVFGQDVAHGKGGVFGATRSLTQKHGNDRCFNTPLAESTIVGIATGMAMAGYHKPIAEVQFADYLWTGINQLFNELSSIHYRSNGEWCCPTVVRMPYGGYIQGGPYHSQSIEAYLAHTPGLKVVIPSNAHDAKCLLKAAVHDPNPVVFLEHKGLYRQRAFCARKEPDDNEIIPLGKAKVVHEGSDITFVGYGMMVVFAYEIAIQLKKEGIEVEVIDLRTVSPLDEETILTSVKKTGKVVVAHEAAKTCGFGAEIAAIIASKGFSYLDAPIKRVTGKNCPVPYCKHLEDQVLPQKIDLMEAIKELASF